MIGPQWKEAVNFLPILCISLSLYPLHAINLNMLQVLGRSDLFLYIEIIKKVVAIIPISLGIFVGIYWMLIASVFTGFIAYLLNSFYTGQKLGYTSWKQLKDIAPSYGIGFLVALAVYFIKFLDLNVWLVLSLQLIVGFSVIIIICEIIRQEEYQEIKKIIFKMINR